jgi:hypothetical protein
MGVSDSCWEDLGLQRDIPVLWLGKMGSKRRKKNLARVRHELSARGVDLLVVDGIENPYVYGVERTELLNRTKIVLNLVREPWDNTSMRFFLAASNRCLIISEPIYKHTPFESGLHYMQSPISDIHETIIYHLENDEERNEITENAFNFVQNELTTRNSISKILCHFID